MEALRNLGPIDKDLVLDVCQSNAEFAHSVLINQQRCFSDFGWWVKPDWAACSDTASTTVVTTPNLKTHGLMEHNLQET